MKSYQSSIESAAASSIANANDIQVTITFKEERCARPQAGAALRKKEKIRVWSILTVMSSRVKEHARLDSSAVV